MLPEPTDIMIELQSKTPARIAAQIGEYRRIAIEALGKIDAEGTVVRTLKGDVIQHPAIKVHADATKAEAALLEKWARRWA